MCPAFGSLRVGLRMRRTATILSGSACCVYGLTFTSHFYGAQADGRLRAVQLRIARHRQALRGHPRRGPRDWPSPTLTTPSSSSTSASRPRRACRCDLLPKEIDGVRIIGIDVPGFGVPTHAEAKDVLAGAMLRYARLEAEHGPVQRAARRPRPSDPAVTLLGELFPADPVGDRRDAGADGPRGRPGRPDARVARPLRAPSTARSWRRRSIRSTPPPCASSKPPGRPIVGSAPGRRRGHGGLARRDRRTPRTSRPAGSTPPRPGPAGDPGRRSPPMPIQARITLSRATKARSCWSPACWSRAAPMCRYVGTACPRTPWSEPTASGSRRKGVHVQYRASLEQDLAAMREVRPDLAHRHHAARPGGEGAGHAGRSTSPTWSRRGRSSGPRVPGRSPPSSRRARGSERFGAMASSSAGSATGHAAGFGWTEPPKRRSAPPEVTVMARGDPSHAEGS